MEDETPEAYLYELTRESIAGILFEYIDPYTEERVINEEQANTLADAIMTYITRSYVPALVPEGK